MTLLTPELSEHWAQLEPLLWINREADYGRAVSALNALLDEVGDDERHRLYPLLDTLGALIEAYEAVHDPLPEVGGVAALKYLMEEHGLRQADLPEIGSQGVVSEILNGKRELNMRQVRALAHRFGVSPAVFI